MMATTHMDVGKSILRNTLFDPIAHALAPLSSLLPWVNPWRNRVKVVRNIGYGYNPKHHVLDIYIPQKSQGPRPVVMYVHGGGFSSCSKDTHRVFALSLASAGFLVFNINYRLGPTYLYPVPLRDTAQALWWVYKNCEKYGGDPKRLAIGGESAGGNLVTALTAAYAYKIKEDFIQNTQEVFRAIRAVFVGCGFLDLSEVKRLLAHPRIPRWAKAMVRDSALCYLGNDWDRHVQRYPLASPLLMLEQDPPEQLPPFFISCGTKDPLLSQSRRLKRALDRWGKNHHLLIQPGELHGSEAFVWRAAARQKWVAANEFLHKHLNPLPISTMSQSTYTSPMNLSP
jgi:acetyl esterase